MGYYEDITQQMAQTVADWQEMKRQLFHGSQMLEKQKQDLLQLVRERQIGFPTLAQAFEEYLELQDKSLVDFLKYKKVPGIKTAELVSGITKARRQALAENKILKYQISYYESIAPFLLDFKEEVEDISEEDRAAAAGYTPEEREDSVSSFLTINEYRKLDTTAKNQLALDRYWKRPLSKVQIGKMYERYVGYLYESRGYEVEYVGIFKGLEDLGRDIIASKGKDVVVVQCKNWSKFRTIYEKHIFQFFGTVFQYRDANPGKNVHAVFATSTELSDVARRFAKELGIELKEKMKMDKQYPCIKCNVSAKGEKIYHLPFDQQYDRTKITTKRGDLYVATVKEAEDAGFRRAKKWSGMGTSQSNESKFMIPGKVIY
ncbi:MAG: hypothetical protein NVSMB46_04480 [Candidatus Saccharimonadales bacterium]